MSSMSSLSEYLENLIDESGGLGRFQCLLILLVLGSKFAATWSVLMMTFAGAIPDWHCHGDVLSQNQKLNTTDKACTVNGSTCSEFEFDGSMNTIINQWDLVCDKDWISETMTTVQMAGLLVGGLLSGHIADAIGRKPAYFLSMGTLVVFNLCAGFSVSWQMFTTFRFFIGLSSGSFLAVFYGFLLEFTPKQHRPLILGIPAWAAGAVLFAFVAKWLHDWRHVHFAAASVMFPCLLFWWILPESFRWLVMSNRLKDAEKVIEKMARINRKPCPNLSQLRDFAEQSQKESKDKKTYSILDIFANFELTKITLLMGFGWLACGYSYYAISFGVEALSGDLYLNMFLLSVVEVPAQILTYFFLKWLGRKWSGILFFIISGVSGLVVGGLQLTDVPNKPQLVNGFSLTTKLGVTAGWTCLQTLTSETYPTVIRNIGYGTHSSISRIGAMIAPQIVYVNKSHLPGILYFLCGGAMLLSAISTLLLQETKDKVMPDTISESRISPINKEALYKTDDKSCN